MCIVSARSSNFELLRIIAILFITLHHLVINNANVCGYNKPYDFSSDGVVGICLNSLVIIGVNLFILISGWFGIRRIWSNVIRLVVDVAVFGLINVCISWCLFGYAPSCESIFHTCNYMENWYVLHFILLILVSPFLEKALHGASSREIGYFVFLFTIVAVYFGWRKAVLNPSGYNVLNFIYLYVLARYLRICVENRFVCWIAKYGLWLWALFAMMNAVIYFTLTKYSLSGDPIRFCWSYNSPLVLLCSVSFFLFFAKRTVRHNPFINLMATGTLGVYVLQSTRPFSTYRGLLFAPFYESASFAGLFVFALLLFIFFDGIASAYTYLYRKIETKLKRS